MFTVPLLIQPRQELTVTLDGVRFDITLVAVGDAMYNTILANEIPITTGVKCAVGFQLMPARWMEGTTGNFCFQTPNGEIPWWQNFGSTHILFYASASELAFARSGYASV